MIFRRIAQSLREQNWTATLIEFVLLVVGVFLGIQVSNWNDERVQAKAEARMLVRLEEDFRAIEPLLARSVERFERTIASTATVITLLRHPVPPADEAGFRKLLGNAAYLWYLPPISVVYTELTAAGGISNVSDPALRTALTRYGTAYTLYAQIQPQAKAALTNPQSRYYVATEWSVDPAKWQGDEAIERYDWPALREARGELQIWQGFQDEVASTAKQQLTEVRAVLAILERARP